MQIVEHFLGQNPTYNMTYLHLGRTGEQRSVTEAVLTEHQIRLFVNSEPTAALVCLPQFLPELILGHLLTEGMIAAADEVERITLSEDGAAADIVRRHDLPNHCRALCPVKPMDWRTEWVFGLADRFTQGMPLHSQTFATHSCFLARENTVLFACEDIGRHNALDKAIGYALRNGIPLDECLIYSSGRMPVDMVSKAIRAGVPVLASKGSPTANAVELARQCGLTLLCATRHDRLKQFSGPPPLAR